MANRIKIQVLDNSYTISTDRTEMQMRVIEADLNVELRAIQEVRPSLSMADILVVQVLNLMDRLSTNEESMDRMREQLSQYLEDASKGRVRLEEAQQEIRELKKKLNEEG